MTNLLTLANAADKGAVAETNFQRLDPLLNTPAVFTAIKVDYILIKVGASYHRATCVQDGDQFVWNINPVAE